MEDPDHSQFVRIAIVYHDDDMIELKGTIHTEVWRGEGRCYDTQESLAEFATALQRFTEGGADVTLGHELSEELGAVGLRFYRVDLAGHIACEAKFAVSRYDTSQRFQHGDQITLTFGCETWSVIRFAGQLAQMARTRSGHATLAIVVGA